MYNPAGGGSPCYRLRFPRRGKLRRARERRGGQHVRRLDAADRGNGRDDRPVFRGGHYRWFSLPQHGSRRPGQNNAGQNDRRLQYGEAHDRAHDETGPPPDAAGSQGNAVDKQPDL